MGVARWTSTKRHLLSPLPAAWRGRSISPDPAFATDFVNHLAAQARTTKTQYPRSAVSSTAHENMSIAILREAPG